MAEGKKIPEPIQANFYFTFAVFIYIVLYDIDLYQGRDNLYVLSRVHATLICADFYPYGRMSAE